MRKFVDKISTCYYKSYGRRILFLLLMFILVQYSFASGAANDIKDTNNITQNSTTVKGTVKDQSGDPLIGVSVVVKGTTTGAITDVDGGFSVRIPDGNHTLVFSLVGFHTQEIALRGKTSLDIVMVENAKVLDDVVVVGYGTMKRSDVATAISTIKPEDFNNGGAANRDVMSLLEGRVAGLSVTRTGGSSPTSGVAVQMRGVVSINGDKSPLIIIDGVPGGNLNLLQPGDIESMDILKDGSAAAIYGSRANAGVIIITTKKGTKGTPRFEYSTYFSRYYKFNTPEFMNADEFKSAMSSLGNDPSSYDRGGNTNMYDEIIDKNNLSQNHNFSVTGGSESTSYRASVFYGNLSGIGKANTREQWGGRFSVTSIGLNDKLTFQSNISLIQENMNRLGNEGWESALKANPTNPMYNEDGTFYEDLTSDENKYARLFEQKNRRYEITSGLDAKLIFEPIKDLKFSMFGSLTRNSYDDNVYYEQNSRTSLNSYEGGGYASKYHYVRNKSAVEPTAEYSKLFLDKHNVSIVGGYSHQYTVWEEFSANNSGFLNDATGENDLGAGSYLKTGKAGMASNKESETLIAFFGRVNYIFDNKYILQASLRREGSSKFGKNNKWGNFPSISAAWNVSNESFMESVSALSNLKLRIGYGETGNSGIGPYQSISTLGTGNPYLTDDGTWQQTYGPNKNPNPNLKWETKKEWNIGIDFGIAGNRIKGAIDLYKREADDLLLQNVLAPQPSNIHGSYTTNIGSLSSDGIELTLNATAISTKDLNWNVAFTGSKIFTNKLKKFSANSADYYSTGGIGGYGALGDAVRLYEGDEIGNFWGKRFAGFDADGDWLFYNKDGEAVSANKITDADKTVIGNGAPKWRLGLVNTVFYKNFDFTVGFIGKFGFDILNRQKMAYENVETLRSGYNVLKTVFTDGVDASYQYSDYYLENGNYVKLDNLTVGYTLPKIPYISSARVYVTARDLFYITSYSGESPELDDTGLSPSMAPYVSSPVTRSFSIGCNIQF